VRGGGARDRGKRVGVAVVVVVVKCGVGGVFIGERAVRRRRNGAVAAGWRCGAPSMALGRLRSSPCGLGAEGRVLCGHSGQEVTARAVFGEDC
jgi:hypothetical protein